MAELILGLDIGTTSVKCVVIESVTYKVIASSSAVLDAYVKEALPHREQCVLKILRAVTKVIAAIPDQVKRNVSRIGTSGQMHGVVLWKKSFMGEIFHLGLEPASAGIQTLPEHTLSNLITWEDPRCGPNFLKSLPASQTVLPYGQVASGFGCASLFWLLRNKPGYISHFSSAGTIQDLLVVLLTGNSNVTMTDHNAHSWGFFDPIKTEWQELDKEFPSQLLPTIVSVGTEIGHLYKDWNGLKRGVKIYAAVGDFQASLMAATRGNPKLAMVNIGTSSQLAYLSGSMGSNAVTCADQTAFFPFTLRHCACVAASLNGGNVLEALVESLCEFVSTFSTKQMTRNEAWSILVEKALVTETDIIMKPTLFGERHDPSLTASIHGLKTNNTSVGSLMRAACRGLVDNLLEMIPLKTFHTHGILGIATIGGAIAKNPVLYQEIEGKFKELGEVIRCEKMHDAAFGAALFCLIGKL